MGNLSHNTKLTLALAFVFLGFAFMLGLQVQKINNLDERMVRVEGKLDQLLTWRGLSKK